MSRKDNGMLCDDFLDGFLELHGKPKLKKTFWQRIVYTVKKPFYDNIVNPMKWKLINLTCLVKGHEFKLMFKPDFRKGRRVWFHYFCKRCCAHVDITYINEDKKASQTGAI